MLLGFAPYGVTASGRVISDTVDYTAEGSYRTVNTLAQSFVINGPRLVLGGLFRTGEARSTADTTFEAACLLTSRWNHYGHWVLEHSLKLRALKKYEQETGNKPTIVVEQDIPDWKIEFFELLGFPRDRLLEWEWNSMAVQRLVVPSYPEPSYDAFNWLRTRIYDNIDKGLDVESPPRVYLSRRNQSTRHVKNESEIIDILEDYDFEICIPERLSVAEQAKYFSDAEVIVGPHGSAFTNAIFSESAHLLEFFGDRIPTAFYRLSLVMGHDYDYLLCHQPESDQDLVVDPVTLENKLGGICNLL